MINVALVNNAPDPAFRRTSWLFERLLAGAAQSRPVRLHTATLPGRRPLSCVGNDNVLSWDRLVRLVPIDAAIVTGAEPSTVDLHDEPFWPALSALFDWAERQSLPLVLSCLAAHAGVLHFDGIPRVRLRRKRLGVFRARPTGDDALGLGMGQSFDMPHSRWNTIDEAHLAARAYRIIARSSDTDVDSFVCRRSATVLYLQGHPEYGRCSLLAEHRRDIGRHLAALAATWPEPPERTLTKAGLERLARFRRDVGRPDAATRHSEFPLMPNDALRPVRWGAAASRLLANWLDELDGAPYPPHAAGVGGDQAVSVAEAYR